MKDIIALDARMIEYSGIGVYIQNIINSGLYEVAVGNKETIHKYNPSIDVVENGDDPLSFKSLIAYPTKELHKRKVKLIHFPHFNAPLNIDIPYVITIHDLIFFKYHDVMPSVTKRNVIKFWINNSIKKSKKIFTVSNYSKKDICEMFKVEENKVTVTYNAVSQQLLQKKGNSKVLDKYNIDKKKVKVLYVGNLKPHKNLKRLLLAVSKSNYKDSINLILAGKAFDNNELMNYEKDLGINDIIIHTGLVEDADLIGLYEDSDIFVFPSLYEGFGIPPLEAMHYNLPVICSCATSLPEVVDHSAMIIDPYNVDSIANALDTMISSPKLRKRYIELGKKQEEKFRWEITTQTMKNEIDSLNL